MRMFTIPVLISCAVEGTQDRPSYRPKDLAAPQLTAGHVRRLVHRSALLIPKAVTGSLKGPCSARVEIAAEGQIQLNISFPVVSKDDQNDDVSRWIKCFTAHLRRILRLAVSLMLLETDQIPSILQLEAVGELEATPTNKSVILPVIETLRTISAAVHSGSEGTQVDCLSVEVLGVLLPKVSSKRGTLEPCTEPRTIWGLIDGVRDLTQVVYITGQDESGNSRSIGLRPDPEQWKTQRDQLLAAQLDRREITCNYRVPPNGAIGIQGEIDDIVVGNIRRNLLSGLEGVPGTVNPRCVQRTAKAKEPYRGPYLASEDRPRKLKRS